MFQLPMRFGEWRRQQCRGLLGAEALQRGGRNEKSPQAAKWLLVGFDVAAEGFETPRKTRGKCPRNAKAVQNPVHLTSKAVQVGLTFGG